MTPPRARQHFYGYSHLIDEGKGVQRHFPGLLQERSGLNSDPKLLFHCYTNAFFALHIHDPSLVHRRTKRVRYLQAPFSIEIQLWLLEADNMLWEHILRDELKG